MTRTKPAANLRHSPARRGAVPALLLALMMILPAAGLTAAAATTQMRDVQGETLRLAKEIWAPNPATIREAMEALADGLALDAEPYAGPLPATLADAASAYLAAIGGDPLAAPVPVLDPALDAALAQVIGLLALAGPPDGSLMAWAAQLAVAAEAHDWAQMLALYQARPDALPRATELAPLALALGPALDEVIAILSSGEFAAGMSIEFSGTPGPDVDIPGVLEIYNLDEFILGGPAGTTHSSPTAALTIDLAGSDAYTGAYGCNAIVIDADGADTYSASGCAHGAGIAGIGALIDLNLGALPDGDTYTSPVLAQGVGVGGFGVLVDQSGRDSFFTLALGQGAGVTGAGALLRLEGDDFLLSGTWSQGYGATGAGLVAGGLGHDIYLMPGIGNLPITGQGSGTRDFGQPAGGAGAIVDAGGSDTYIMTSFGMNDGSHDVRGQGYGSILGSGALADLAGRNLLILSAGGMDFAGGSMTAVAHGQGAGEREGQGVLSLAASDANQVYATAFAGTFAFVTGWAGDATSDVLAQGAGEEGGRGGLIGSLGDDLYSARADATTSAASVQDSAAFSVSVDFVERFCSAADYQFGGAFSQAFASCSAFVQSAVTDKAHAEAHAESHAGDAIASARGQGYGFENGVGGLVDAWGNDAYELNAIATPSALAYASSIAIAYSLDFQHGRSDSTAVAGAADSTFTNGIYSASAAAQSGSLASSFSYTIADAAATAHATAVSEAEASVGDGIADTLGQGFGSVNGAGALVDLVGSDDFMMEAVATPQALSAAASAAGASATALAHSDAFSFSQAAASSFAYSFAYGNGNALSIVTDYQQDIVECTVSQSTFDVLFVFDTTGSMGNVISSAKAGATQIMNDVIAAVPGTQFGVADYRDYSGFFSYPGYATTYGGSSDYPWMLDQPITSNTAAVQSAINGLSAAGGADWPESVTRALYESGADPSVAWRAGSTRVIVHFADAPAHDLDFYAPTNYGGDPGPDATAGTADDLDFETVVGALAAGGYKIVAIQAGSGGPAAQSMQYEADQTDGGYETLSGDFVGQVTDLILAEAPDCDAEANANASSVAEAFGSAYSRALAGASADAIAQALAGAFANAEALAAAASATATSVGATTATALGQGYGSLNGVGIFARGDSAVDCEALERIPQTPGVPALREPIGTPAFPDETKLILALLDTAVETPGGPGDALVLCDKVVHIECPHPEGPTLPVTPVVDPVVDIDAVAIGRVGELADIAASDLLAHRIDVIGQSNHGPAPDDPDEACKTVVSTVQGTGSDRVSMHAAARPVGVATSGSQAFAQAEALAQALSVSVAAAEAYATAVAEGVASKQATAIAQAVAEAMCSVEVEGSTSASCTAIATAIAVAIAQAVARATSVAQALSDAYAQALSQALAQARAKEGAAAASSSAVSFGPATARSEGQGRGDTNGLGAYLGGMGHDASKLAASAHAGGGAWSFSSGSGACASSSAVSLAGVTATALGQGHATTAAAGVALDLGGDDAYALGAGASSGVTATATGACDGSANAAALSTGAIASAAEGRVVSDGRAVAGFVDLGGNDSYSGGSFGANGATASDFDIVWLTFFVDA